MALRCRMFDGGGGKRHLQKKASRMMKCRGLWRTAIVAIGLGLVGLVRAEANPTLVIDIDSGEVLYHDMATAPWFPASLTKLMTTYVALSKVREGKISLDTPLRVSAYAAAMAPSKMGFRPGTLVTLDNALKMLMVKSPNDIAVTVAEGISGSVPAFAEEMNAYAAKLGLRESHFDNPNGLPDEHHVSSARDMAIIGRALLREFPDEHELFGIPALSFGSRIINNHNALIGRFPGADGMKTGYTCSAGYNVVATAQRGDRHLMVVILGAPSGHERSERAAALFDHYFSDPGPGEGDVGALAQSDIVLPPDMRGQICGPGRRNLITEAETEDAAIPLAPAPGPTMMMSRGAERAAVLTMAAGGVDATATPGATPPPGRLDLLGPRAPFVPVKVFIGPVAGWTGTVAGPIEASAPGPRPPLPDAAIASKPDPALPTVGGDPQNTPLALAGAVPPSAALAATNKVVKSRGRLSLRAAGRTKAAAHPRAAKPALTKAVTKASAKPPVSKASATKAAAKKKKGRAGKP